MKEYLRPSDRRQPTSKWKARQTAAYLELHGQIAEVLFRHDPVGINFESNTDEYEPEASTILSRLQSARTAADVRAIVRAEFDHWFGDVGPWDDRLDLAANEIWQLWQVSPLRVTH